MRRAGQAERLVRVRDAEGAVSRRGQEDDGLRAGRADGLEAARRDPVSHGWRHRAYRDVEGLLRAGDDGLRGPRPATHVRGPGRRLCPDREGVRGGPGGGAVLGERADARSLRGSGAAVGGGRRHEERPAVVLDRTAFYAESGGQPWDTGTLGGAGVVAVIEEDGEILHVLDAEVADDRVHGRVDGRRRL